MSERPFYTLTGKHFLSGVSGNDYGGYGGIFKKALGVSAIRSIGSFYTTASLGLLQAGPSGGSGGSGVIVDTPLVSAVNAEDTNNSYEYILGNLGHLYKKDGLTTAPTDLAASTQFAKPSNGIAIFQPAGGTKYLYVFERDQINRSTLGPSNYTGATAGTWTVGWKTTANGLIESYMHPTHNFGTSFFFGNDYYIGQIQDNAAADVTFSATALKFPQQYQVNALEDDGFYLIAALTKDKFSNALASAGSLIIFWDTTTQSLWQREFPVSDTIVALKRVGNIVYALGSRGIYSVSFAGGVKKVWQRGTSIANTGATRLIGPGMLSSFNDALVIAGDLGEVAFLGKPDPVLPSGYHTPIVVDAGITTQVSFVDAEFLNGNLGLLIGDASTALKLYPIIYTGGQQAVGVNAETVFLPLAEPRELKRIDVIFGRKLASGDSLTLEVMKNDGSTYVTYGPNGGAITFADPSIGAARRYQAFPITPVQCEDLKFKTTFNGGEVAIRKVEFYGPPIEPKTTT